MTKKEISNVLKSIGMKLANCTKTEYGILVQAFDKYECYEFYINTESKYATRQRLSATCILPTRNVSYLFFGTEEEKFMEIINK